MNTIPVFFSGMMVADAKSYSPSSSKPELVVRSWEELGIPLKLIWPKAMSPKDLYAVHDPRYVDGVLNSSIANGFGNTLREVAHSLPYTSGAMYDAACEAIRNDRVAVAPVSGFHHAGYYGGGGFCTFNGLVATAIKIDRKVGILDCDQHYGNGTDDIIEQLKLQDRVKHYSAGKAFRHATEADEFLKLIPQLMERFSHCAVILYQAGADPHVDDPLGGWLTTKQLAMRDKIVFETAKAMGVPIVWNLAGGYQKDIRKVLNIHDNTMKACWEVFKDKK